MSRNRKRLGKRQRASHKRVLLVRQGYVCALRIHPECPVLLTWETATLDHIVELRCGGTNTVKNLQAACAACNWSKSPHLGKKRRWNNVSASQQGVL